MVVATDIHARRKTLLFDAWTNLTGMDLLVVVVVVVVVAMVACLQVELIVEQYLYNNAVLSHISLYIIFLSYLLYKSIVVYNSWDNRHASANCNKGFPGQVQYLG